MLATTWRRVAAGTLLGLLGLLLAGCHVQGTFDVVSESRIAVDLTVTGDVDCPNSVDALKLTVTSVTDAAGAPACHVTGETEATYFSPFGIEVSRAAEYLVLQASLSGRADEWPTSDVEVRFPGQVVSATRGQASGTSVRISDLGELAQGSGLTVVAIDRPGPPAWVIAAGAGAAGGVLATLLVLLLVRVTRRRRPASGDPLVLSPVDPTQDDPASAPLRADDPGRDGTAPDDPLGNGATIPAGAGPDVAPVSASQPPPQGRPVDPTWFSTPPPADAEAPLPEDPRPSHPDEPATESGPPDHSVWAPPRDAG